MHLAYSTNVHPAEDLPGILSQLDTYSVPVRRRLGRDVLGLGLWLAAPVASALADDAALRQRLRRELDARGLEVVTLNGFPYEAFHAPVVKHAVYRPDWTQRERLQYTLHLAKVLGDLLPDTAARGSISTLPLAWRTPWHPTQAAAARRALDELATGLAKLAGETGRPVRVAFEPEPGCIVETTSQAVEQLSGVDTEWLGVCVDLAHLACTWEEPAAAVRRLDAAGLSIVKVQVSAALEVADPLAAREVLRGYVEPRFLHQTRGPAGVSFDDLDEALAAGAPGPWRILFHVPLHAAPPPPLRATTDVLRDGLAALVDRCDTYEVETYAWSVLPPSQRPDGPAGLVEGIAAEVAYARDILADLT